jgi:predicted PurR-regulated permease PerM
MRSFVRYLDRVKLPNWLPSLASTLALALLITPLGATVGHIANQVGHFWG